MAKGGAIFTLLFMAALFGGCEGREEPTGENPQGGVRETVKEVITKDFKIYEGAKDSLKDSQERAKARSELIEREMK